MKYNCLIIDDNILLRTIVIAHLSKIKNIHIAAVCADGIEAASVLATENIDIVFSDIDMPNLSGIDLLKSLKNPPIFVFITSYAEYAVEGFDLDVMDFILKPPTFERVYKATNKAVEHIELKNLLKKKDVFANSGTHSIVKKENISDEYFFIKETLGITRIRYADVTYIKSMGDFSKIYTLQDSRHITLVSLKNMEKQMPSSIFMRVHKQYIVNLKHITTITGTEIHLSNKQIVPVSLVYRQALLDIVVHKNVFTRFAY